MTGKIEFKLTLYHSSQQTVGNLSYKPHQKLCKLHAKTQMFLCFTKTCSSFAPHLTLYLWPIDFPGLHDYIPFLLKNYNPAVFIDFSTKTFIEGLVVI